MMKEDARQWLNEQFGQDQETIDAVWDEYISSSTAKIMEARQALAAFDFPTLDRVAHTLKGNALMVGDQTFATVAIELRDAAKASDPEAAERKILRLEELDKENHA